VLSSPFSLYVVGRLDLDPFPNLLDGFPSLAGFCRHQCSPRVVPPPPFFNAFHRFHRIVLAQLLFTRVCHPPATSWFSQVPPPVFSIPSVRPSFSRDSCLPFLILGCCSVPIFLPPATSERSKRPLPQFSDSILFPSGSFFLCLPFSSDASLAPRSLLCLSTNAFFSCTKVCVRHSLSDYVTLFLCLD